MSVACFQDYVLMLGEDDYCVKGLRLGFKFLSSYR